MTTLNGFARLGIAGARTVAELRPHLDPAADAAPPAPGSNVVPMALADVDRAAGGAPFIPARKLRGLCAPDAAWILGLDRADLGPEARLRAILGRAHARANWYAWNLAHQVETGRERAALALALGAVLDRAGGVAPDLHAFGILEAAGGLAHARELHRRMAVSVELGALPGRPEDHARRWFLLRLAEAWAASTGERPALDAAPGPGIRKRGGGRWQGFAENALLLAGLAKLSGAEGGRVGGLDSALRSLNAPIGGLGGGRSVDMGEDLAARADFSRSHAAEMDRGAAPHWRLHAGDFQSEGLGIDADSRWSPYFRDPERPAAERRCHGSTPPSGPAEAYGDFAPVVGPGWLGEADPGAPA